MHAYNFASIKTLPVPPVQKFANGTCGMIWHLTLQRAVASKEYETAVKEAHNPQVSFASRIKGAHVTVEVRFLADDYTAAYDATLRLVRHVEERFGQLESIEGVPRSQWDMQLMISKHVMPEGGQ